MIIARLNGQLGNQMFIYAAAYAAARENSEKLAVYKAEYDLLYPGFGFQLRDLQCRDYSRYKGIPAYMYCSTIGNVIRKAYGRAFHKPLKLKPMRISTDAETVREKAPEFSPIILDKTKKYHVVEGFWQSPKYFDKYRSDIVEQFRPAFPLSDRTDVLIDKIRSAEYSVSIHVRRGDYVKIGWDLPMSYYASALKRVSPSSERMTVFVFSDDIQWARDNLPLEGFAAEYVGPDKGSRPFEDVWAMSKCNSNIIANSSYSWWAAYLNNNADKKVIAPVQMKKSNADMLCEDWIAIDSK